MIIQLKQHDPGFYPKQGIQFFKIGKKSGIANINLLNRAVFHTNVRRFVKAAMLKTERVGKQKRTADFMVIL